METNYLYTSKNYSKETSIVRGAAVNKQITLWMVHSPKGSSALAAMVSESNYS